MNRWLFLCLLLCGSALGAAGEDTGANPVFTDPESLPPESEYPDIYRDEPPPYIHVYEPIRDGSDEDIAATATMYNAFVEDYRNNPERFEHLQMHYPSATAKELASFFEDLARTLGDVADRAPDRKEKIVCSGRPKNEKAIYDRIKSVKEKSNSLITRAIKELEKRHDQALVGDFWKHAYEFTDGYSRTVSVPEERNVYSGITDYDYYTDLCGDDE